MKLLLATAAVAVLMASSGSAQDAPWRPEFIKENTPAQYLALFPPRALQEKLTGGAVLKCVATADGRLTDCTVLNESHAGYGFGEAALKAVLNERIKAKDAKGASVAGRSVTTRLEFLAPGDSNPDWLRKPTGGDLASVFPVAAMEKGANGRAVIGCGVTVEGFLADCRVVSEQPENLGFGAAALQLAPQFRMTPKVRGGKPVAATVTIPVVWSEMEGMRTGPSGARVILDPPWITTPTAEDVRLAWPEKRTEKAATATIRCRLTPKGGLRWCETIAETPRGRGFGRAAEKLATKFSVRVTPENAKDIADFRVDIPFRFRNPSEPDTRAVTRPKWITALSPESVALVFPKQATAAGLSAGRGIINCLVEVGGKLGDCKVVSEEPAGLGFGDAAVVASGYMTMNPWSVDGDPLDGLRVTLPIRLMVTDEPEPTPPAAP